MSETYQTVVLSKAGTVQTVQINGDVDLDDFTETQYFTHQGTSKITKISDWQVYDTTMVMYGYRQGEAGMENKHELPPPVDSDLYFGDILVVMVDENGQIQEMGETTYRDFYEKQLGGFECLSEVGSDSEATSNLEPPSDSDSDFDPPPQESESESETESLASTESESDRHTSASDYSDLVESEDELELASQLHEEALTEKSQQGDGFDDS